MENSNLLLLVKSFSKTELKEIRRFLASPIYNLRQDLQDLFDFILREEQPNKEMAFAHLHAATPYDDTKMRLLMSYLNRLLEQYLILKENEEENLRNDLQLARAYRRRGLNQAYERNIKSFEVKLEKQPLRNVSYHQLVRDLSFEKQEMETTKNPTDTTSTRLQIETTDAHYLATRLRLLCLEAAQKNVYHSTEIKQTNEDILKLAQRIQRPNEPAIQLYLAAYQALTNPESDVQYRHFSALMEKYQSVFLPEEMREFHLFAINHCIQRMNKGKNEFAAEALKLYRTALSSLFLLENGLLSRFTFHNIVAAGLRADELDWVHDFIHTYKSKLERRYRESSVSFNLARLEWAHGRLESVLSLLQQANYRDPLLNLAAKTLLMKTYYAMEAFDLLQSHLDAMRNYINRKYVLGYHRTNYLNIVRYMDRIIQLNPMDKSAIRKLASQIENEAVLTERAWLLECIFPKK